MNDWDIVTKAEPRKARGGSSVGRSSTSPFNPTRQFRVTFPRLTQLLSHANLTEVILDEQVHLLFSWRDASDEVLAWLSPLPSAPSGSAAPDHQILLASFGGIIERYNEPTDNWLLNLNEALVAVETLKDASFMSAYAWAFEECGGIPIDPARYYPVAREANGNCVLCERTSGQLLFFAPDHADRNLTPFDSCPMYTLHVHRYVTTLRDWVEHVAEQWLNAVRQIAPAKWRSDGTGRKG